MSYERTQCGFCKCNDLVQFLDLGITPLTDAFLQNTGNNQNKETEIYAPLSVLSCRKCGLAQLSQVLPPAVLYNESYVYDAAVTKTGRDHWKSMAETAWRRFDCIENDLIIDIGSNTGTLLENFKKLGGKELGVDPARVPASIALSKGLETLVTVFCLNTANQILQKYGKAKIICATNVFAHIDNVSEILKSIDILLEDDGVFIVEAPHFLELIKKLEYDTIYHEHLYYLAAKPMESFIKKCGFSLFDIEKESIHGGSLRYYICRPDSFPVNISVENVINEEISYGLYNEDTLHNFARLVNDNKVSLRSLILDLKRKGKVIAAAGASAKGMTLTNYCKLDKNLIDFISEKSELKIGKLSPGMHIPVVSDAELISKNPDYCLLLAWNFADEIIQNLSEYRKKGGKFIVPFPEPHIV